MQTPFMRYEQGREVFCADTLITFGQCDATGRFRISELMTLFADAAGEDFAQRGMSYDQLLERDVAFLLSRLSIRLEGDLQAGMAVTLRTWENGSRGSQFLRSFSLTTQEGKPLVQALSSWTTVVPSTRRIVRPTDLLFEGRNILERTADCLAPDRLRAPGELAPLGKYQVGWSDLDRNGHVNNARYAAVVYNALSAEERTRPLKDFRIDFAHESVENDVITMHSAPLPDGRFVTGTTSRGDCFRCELWYA